MFGRGFGEALVVHLGDGQWAVVDSCLNPETGRPAAIEYLTSIGVDLEAVVLIVVTHWDDDHVEGIAEIATACTQARLVCSAALCRKEILEFVLEQDAPSGSLSSGVDELRTILKLAASRGGIVWAKANLPLHPRPPGISPAVVALAPSEDAVERSIRSLIELATGKPTAVRRRYRAPEGPNGASVVTAIQRANTVVLLGADLERTTQNPQTGWDAVLAYARPTALASLVKVPHHGSEDAHHEGIWAEIVEPEAVAILTPWSNGDQFLPHGEDLDRILATGAELYLAAMPSLRRATKDREVARLIGRLHSGELKELTGWGQVRARRTGEESRWRVECAGDARLVEHRA